MVIARTVPEDPRDLTHDEAVQHLSKGFPVCIACRLTLKPATYSDKPGPDVGNGMGFKIGDQTIYLDHHECLLMSDMLKSWADQLSNTVKNKTFFEKEI